MMSSQEDYQASTRTEVMDSYLHEDTFNFKSQKKIPVLMMPISRFGLANKVELNQ